MPHLCLKNKTVLTLRNNGDKLGSIARIDNPELLPVQLRKDCSNEAFYKWLNQRTIPPQREGLRILKEAFGEKWCKQKNYACLSDQYWIQWREEEWKRINFFTNVYSTEIGNMFFEPWTVTNSDRMSNNSPDLTTGGLLKKRWKQKRDRTSYLIKAGSYFTKQEPLSEVLVSVLAEKLDVIDCVSYDLCIEGTSLCSKCDNFITQDTELVPASAFYFDEERKENESVFSHLIKMCEKNKIPGAEDFIKGMIFIDTLTGNEDRHLTNIGFIRDVNTLKFLGPAPLFDSGNAYWSQSKISDGVNSELFMDVQGTIFKKMQKKCNLDKILKDKSFQTIIKNYPGISDEKKDALVSAIDKRNLKLLRNKDIER